MIAFIEEHRNTFGVGPACKVLQVAPSIFYARRATDRNPDLASDRAKRDIIDQDKIKEAFDGSGKRYGARKIWHELRRNNHDIARCIVGWRVSTSMTTGFVLDALNQAICQRVPSGAEDLIHHSDRGSQYLSIKYTERLVEAGIDPSVGSVGDSYDNALAESTIGLFKTEVIDFIGPWKSAGQLEWKTLKWVSWYNTKRLHSKIRYITPKEARENFYEALNTAQKAD